MSNLQRQSSGRQIVFTSLWGYFFNVLIVGFVGVVESGRICSALPDWASAILIPIVPVFGSLAIAYLDKHKVTLGIRKANARQSGQ